MALDLDECAREYGREEMERTVEGLTKAEAEITRLRAELNELKTSVATLAHPVCRLLLADLDAARAEVERLRVALEDTKRESLEFSQAQGDRNRLLSAKVERLVRERESAALQGQATLDERDAEITRLRAEGERLRKALRTIAEYAPPTCYDFWPMRHARAELETTP